MDDQDRQAEAFLRKHRLVLHADFKGEGCPSWCLVRYLGAAEGEFEHCHGDRYEVSVMQKESDRILVLDYWGTMTAKETGDRPSNYHLLGSLSSIAPWPQTLDGIYEIHGPYLPIEQAFEMVVQNRSIHEFFLPHQLADLAELSPNNKDHSS